MLGSNLCAANRNWQWDLGPILQVGPWSGQLLRSSQLSLGSHDPACARLARHSAGCVRSGRPQQSDWDPGRRCLGEARQVWAPRVCQVDSTPRGLSAGPNRRSARLHLRPGVGHRPPGAIQYPLPNGDSSPVVTQLSHLLAHPAPAAAADQLRGGQGMWLLPHISIIPPLATVIG